MIKYLGSIGTFIRLNDNDNKTYQLLNVYSSSAAKLSLFSAGNKRYSFEVKAQNIGKDLLMSKPLVNSSSSDISID
jgi:hypothetical protein